MAKLWKRASVEAASLGPAPIAGGRRLGVARFGGGGGGGALIPGAPPQDGVDHETSWVWVFQK
eukprot:scaffold62153_cov61-Phaeocystis_antarctica.AAC.6